MKLTRRSKFLSFFFSPALISLFFLCSEKWQSSFLITVFFHVSSQTVRSCGGQSASEFFSAHGRRAVCLFSPFANTEPSLIQRHSLFLLSTPGGGPRHLANATGDELYGVLNRYLMAKFCHLNFTYTHPQPLKDHDRTLARHYNAFITSFLCALSICGAH